MQVIYETSTEIDATMLAHHLRGLGLQADVLGGTLGMAAGELPVSFLYRVGVPIQDLDAAVAALNAWQNQNDESPDDDGEELTGTNSQEDVEHDVDTSPTIRTMMIVVTVLITIAIVWLALAQ